MTTTNPAPTTPEALLPCPFCGSADVALTNEEANNTGGYYVACSKCDASTGLRYACGEDPRPLLVEQWNRRAAQAEGQQPAFNRECDDADELLRLLGFEPDDVRTDGGSINLPKVRSLLRERAEGQQPAEPPGQESGFSVSERAALSCMLPIFKKLLSGAVFTADKAGEVQAHMNTLQRAAATPPAPAQGVSGLGRVIRDDEWLQLHFVSDVAADAFADALKITVDVEDMPPLKAAPAPASAPSADLSAAILALPLPEPDGWAVEFRGTPVAFVTNGEKAAGAAVGARGRVFTEAKVRALLESAASLVRATPPDLAAELRECSTAAIDVLAERRRQIEVEGWTPEHDDEHGDGQMALAAGAYAVVGCTDAAPSEVPAWWPWPGAWWKPSTNRRNLVKAAALLLAEIDRLDRDALRAKGASLVSEEAVVKQDLTTGVRAKGGAA